MPTGYVGRSQQWYQAPPQEQQWWQKSLASDFGRLVDQIRSGFTAPGNALAGNYDERTVDPTTGAIAPFDPRMVDDAANTSGMVSLGAGALPAEVGALRMGIKAYHGSPHSFDRFDMSKIGTGEGAQAYGHGLYFAENEGIAKGYRDALSGHPDPTATGYLFKASGDKTAAIKAMESDLSGRAPATHIEALRNEIQAYGEPRGSMYAVDINAQPEHFLDWDKPLSAQSQHVQDALVKAGIRVTPDQLGQTIWKRAAQTVNPDHSISHSMPDAAMAKLRDAGIAGIRYLDNGSRGKSEVIVGDYPTAGNPPDMAWTARSKLGDVVKSFPSRDEAVAWANKQNERSRNFVVFDDKNVSIDKKYAVPGGAPTKQDSAPRPPLPKIRLST